MNIRDALEVIRWYQFQIAVKIRRGLMRDEFDDIDDSESDEDTPEAGPQSDSDGSVEVALIGIAVFVSAMVPVSLER